jgi:tetratricopeptide (TPR) repeat protein
VPLRAIRSVFQGEVELTDEIRPATFFVVGGTLRLEAPSYIKRAADEELLRLTVAGEYCNVLTARQMGKSSLMVRTADQLRAQGVRAVIIDLTSIGSKAVTASEWYFGLVSALAKQLNLTIAEQWWQAHAESGPVQRFSDFLREVVLEAVAESIVVFVDEIDSTLKQDFTDDFFAAIRAAYNARATDPVYRRITFVLLGVARPADLIKDRTRTPYNIGINVDVTDFRFEELHSFCEVLEAAYPGHGEESLKWVLDWTGGQPYLTQKISAEIVTSQNSELTEEDVDATVERLFLTQTIPNDTNLRSIPDRVRTSPYAGKMLRIYRNLLKEKRVVKEERSVAQNELKLAGLIRETSQGTLEVKNRLYAHVFDENWARANTPIDRAVVIASIATAVAVLLLIALIASLVIQWNQPAEIKAQTFMQQFQSSSPDVRLTGLAGLFSLGDQYAQQARDSFYGLSTTEQLALFKLSTPQNVANELVAVVEGVYQKADNTTSGIALLASMSDILRQVGLAEATSLTTEIEFWVQGRELADKDQYEAAISLYDRALSESEKRNHANSGIYLDRAMAYVALKQYDAALQDFEAAVALDKDRQSVVTNQIVSNPPLLAYWSSQSNKYTGLSAILPTITPTSTPESGTFTPTPTWALTPTPTQTPTPTSTPTSRPPTPGSPTPSPTQQVPSVNGIQFGSMTYGPHRQTITDGMNMETGGLSIYYTIKNTSDHNVLVLGNQGVAMRSPNVDTFLGGGVKWPGLTGRLNPGQIAEIEVRLPFDLNCQNCEIYPSISSAWQDPSRQTSPESWQPSLLHNQVSIMPPTQDLVFSGTITGVSAQRIAASSAKINITYEGLDPNATYSFVVWSPDLCPDDTKCLDYMSSQQSLSGYPLRGAVRFIPEVDGKGVITAVVEGISCKGGPVTTNNVTIASVRVSPPSTYIRPQSFPLVYTWCE